MAVKTASYKCAGVPHIDPSACSYCRLCATICPTETLWAADDGIRVNKKTALGCIACGQCMAVCPDGAITVSKRGISPEDSIELPPVEKRAKATQLLALMQARRSIRDFDGREVPEPALDLILDMASAAPMGVPPSDVGVLVFHGHDKVRGLVEDGIAMIERSLKYHSPTMLTLLRPVYGKAMTDMFRTLLIPAMSSIVGKWYEGEDWLLYNAPLALLFYGSPYADPADDHIAATYAMLAAESLGLGTCLIGMVGPLMQYDKQMKRKYKIPRGHKPGLVLLAGYPQYRFSGALKRRFAEVRIM